MIAISHRHPPLPRPPLERRRARTRSPRPHPPRPARAAGRHGGDVGAPRERRAVDVRDLRIADVHANHAARSRRLRPDTARATSSRTTRGPRRDERHALARPGETTRDVLPGSRTGPGCRMAPYDGRASHSSALPTSTGKPGAMRQIGVGQRKRPDDQPPVARVAPRTRAACRAPTRATATSDPFRHSAQTRLHIDRQRIDAGDHRMHRRPSIQRAARSSSPRWPSHAGRRAAR